MAAESSSPVSPSCNGWKNSSLESLNDWPNVTWRQHLEWNGGFLTSCPGLFCLSTVLLLLFKLVGDNEMLRFIIFSWNDYSWVKLTHYQHYLKTIKWSQHALILHSNHRGIDSTCSLKPGSHPQGWVSATAFKGQKVQEKHQHQEICAIFSLHFEDMVRDWYCGVSNSWTASL